MKRSILLVKIETGHSNYIPYGLLYVASALLSRGYKVHIVHCRDTKLGIFKKTLDEHKRDLLFVGFSLLSCPSILPTLQASGLAKKENIPVVWGGVHPSILPALCLKEENVDFVVINEGEETACELASTLERQEYHFSRIDGLAFKDKGRVVINQARMFIEDIDKYFPAYGLVDLKGYFQNRFGCKRMLPILSSRGCPYHCGFCYITKVHRNRWRAHSVSFVLKQVEYLKEKYNIDGIYWHDDNFFVDKNRGMEIIEKTNLPCFGEIRADYITEDFAKWLKGTKFKCILIGAESGSQRVLDFIQKGESRQDIINAVRRMKYSDILLHLNFIVGFAIETKEEKKETIRFIGELKKINPNIEVNLQIYTPYPGTPLWRHTLEHGFMPPQSNMGWALMDRKKCVLPWENAGRIEKLCKDSQKFFQIYYNKQNLVWKLFGWLEKFRWRAAFFAFPIEIWLEKEAYKLLKKIKERFIWYRHFVAFVKGKR